MRIFIKPKILFCSDDLKLPNSKKGNGGVSILDSVRMKNFLEKFLNFCGDAFSC